MSTPIHVGIEIGGTKLQLALGTAAGEIRERHRSQVDVRQGGPGIRERLEDLLRSFVAPAGAVAVGVGFGGPVDWPSGRICRSHQIEGWDNFPLAEWLRSASGLPVAVDNDANVAALGEAKRGAGQGSDPVFYVTLGSGVGGGLVCRGDIYHGAIPGESEIGHVRLDRQGTVVESRCSGWSIDRRLRQLALEFPDSLLARTLGPAPGGEARHLPALLAADDPGAERILDELVGDLAFALSHVVHLSHPQVIVLGGGLSLMGEPLCSAVAAELPRHVMAAFAPGPAIRLAELGEDAVPVGALILAGRCFATDSGHQGSGDSDAGHRIGHP